MSDLLTLLTEPFAYGFMVNAFIVATAAAIVCALLSCWLVLIGWSLLGDAVSHAVLPGVVLAYMLGLPFTVGALVFGLASVGLIGVLRDTSRVKGDAAIGVVFTGFFATGLILKSRYPSNTDLNSIIFGNVLGISPADRTMVLALALGAAVVLIARRRDLTLFAFDPVHAHAIGLRPGRINALLLVLLALTTIVALQVVGVILVVAMLIVPGTTAHLLTDRMGRMLIIAPLIATVSTVVGLYIAYWTNASAAGWVTVCQALAFLAAYLGSPRHGVLPRLLRRRAGESR
ncbi:metal ABC transporter permease [Actinomyces bowdenii]|uniref:Metal ABC transporter permease n=1 Tax=Actinomyces bowdenii TaxID=131109 RepID=A0A853EF63_9ACTO|nr:metal ABC transporter permease [Actinomyces bowdenii]MBF0695785.1 metal ABC transporter permease [Actinomyces bowdenii]NYS67958.1 metal ABC transporter permease [Actinomyces bowdenii]